MKKIRVKENRIWKYRITKGLKQCELAFLIGHATPTQVSRYERGLVMPECEQLIKLSQALDVDIDVLYPQFVEKWREEVEERKKAIKSQ